MSGWQYDRARNGSDIINVDGAVARVRVVVTFVVELEANVLVAHVAARVNLVDLCALW